MAGFSELIKNFNKIRDYMRDFYIYGFMRREDFKRKSSRTYDDEKRRIESYLGNDMKWEYGRGGKVSFISLDSSRIRQNPLHAAWKSKSFTANDIMLHFYILDVLSGAVQTNARALCVNELTDLICERSERVFDPQLVRLKCVEYEKQGILFGQKDGRTVRYRLSQLCWKQIGDQLPFMEDAVRFFQGSAPFGEIGGFLLDNEDLSNDIFSFKHHYIVHTLEDGILFELLAAVREGRKVQFENFSERTKKTTSYTGIPLKIFVSVVTGRRYICIRDLGVNRFVSCRLDYVKAVKILETYTGAEAYRQELLRNLDKVWGASFNGIARTDLLSMKLLIHKEKEQYIIDRVLREGRGGRLAELEDGVFLYTKECFDAGEMAPWIKTFTGRILALECSNREVADRFYQDITRMHEMYCPGGS